MKKEISKEQAKELSEGSTFILYNPLTNQYKEEISNPKDIVHNKFCYDGLKFYIEVEDNE